MMNLEELWNWASEIVAIRGDDRIATWDYMTDCVAATAGLSELQILIAAGLTIGADGCQRGRDVLAELRHLMQSV